MLDIQAVSNFVQEYGVVDFGAELEEGSALWFRGIDDHFILIVLSDNEEIVMSVWDNEECGELVDEIEIDSIDELGAYLDKYALTNKTATDTTMIDIYVKLIKEKLAENNISLNFEECNQAERLIIRHIEGELAKIVEFLR
ncbi:hypothetical protein D6D69_01450 [Moraxella catarrhalis]|uniref:hypothetical protein n=1 Tax=Moraxella catarrhalis TaxID=480 RepID=UPI0007E44EF1|nr:hypothetical protein [Moraxella catarrhalis]MPY07425.1 hypothetical protein [Moraxella catarrhalis]OAV09525.1 hypothetical protein AO378_1204 [Moraxella catarrhalis]OAV14931.1 hypothetical protein AO380_0025 [Moraxella catarrhalis]OAV23706.1 hypothetical protein AO371_1197 [Moraxella catarrhalis]OAV31704.1 hypothetical protein AO367_0224 [Moraxella catarrhalis]